MTKSAPKKDEWDNPDESAFPVPATHWGIQVSGNGMVILRFAFKDGELKKPKLIKKISMSIPDAKQFVKFVAPFLGLKISDGTDGKPPAGRGRIK